MFETIFQSELEIIEDHLKAQLRLHFSCPRPELERFWQSMEYSLHTGGKRFRPLLSLLVAKALSQPLHNVLDLAAAVEMIHTYSLIHDDLPCMDNDDFRRGQPTNHKIYGDGAALLAGEALFTLAFDEDPQTPSEATARVAGLLAEAAGAQGMVGGQVLDVESNHPDLDLLNQIHARKTGCLIRVAVEGAAVLCGAKTQSRLQMRTYGELLGLAFQLADDLEDYNPAKPEKISYVSLLGFEATRDQLNEVSRRALAQVEDFGLDAEGLRHMVRLNCERV